MLIDLVEEFFKQEGWLYIKQGSALITRLESGGKEWHLLAQPRESQLILFISIASLPEQAKEREVELLKLLNKINVRMALGSFALIEEGKKRGVQFVTSLDALNERNEVMEKSLLFALMRRIAHYNLQIFDLYLPHIKAVSEGQSVEEAFQSALKDLKAFGELI